jgi:xylan 1,4-beta-xylosidase
MDSEHGNVLREYAAMGSPLDPTPLQVAQLDRKTALPAAEPLRFQDNKLEVQLSANAIVLIVARP